MWARWLVLGEDSCSLRPLSSCLISLSRIWWDAILKFPFFGPTHLQSGHKMDFYLYDEPPLRTLGMWSSTKESSWNHPGPFAASTSELWPLRSACLPSLWLMCQNGVRGSAGARPGLARSSNYGDPPQRKAIAMTTHRAGLVIYLIIFQLETHVETCRQK